MFSGIKGVDGTVWYHPVRLSLDGGAVAGGVKNPAQKVLGVRATHGADVHLPIYAIETSLGAGRVLRGARRSRDGRTCASDWCSSTGTRRTTTSTRCRPCRAGTRS